MLTPAELVLLIAAVAKGDEAAFERLYAATRAKLFGVVLRILRRQDLAEEVVQEAYVKIWSSAGQFNTGLSSPSTGMASIARNRAMAVGSRIGKSWCCLPITMAGAASNWRRSSRRR